jgi:TonB family protein
MAPLTKDTLEVTNSASDANKLKSGNPAKAEQPAGHLRADAVSLEVPVKVHGSRVMEVVREVTPHTEPFEEQTSTMIVFPQGAVIRMSTAVSVGQMLVVTNSKSRQDAICRVVKVRTFSNLQGYVEVEFTHKQPGYWNVYFPSDGPPSAIKPSQPVAVETAPPTIKTAPIAPPSEISWAPAPEPVAQKQAEPDPLPPAIKSPTFPAPIASAPKPEAPFISIGSQEEVQPPAATIAKPAPQLTPHVESVKKPAAQVTNASSMIESLPPPPVLTAPTISSPDSRAAAASSGSEALAEPAPAVEAPGPVVVRSTFGSLSGGATLGSNRAESVAVGEPELHSSTEVFADQKSPSGKNWVLIGVSVAVLAAAVVAGAIFFRPQPANRTAAAPSPAVLTQPAVATNSNVTQPAGTGTATSSASTSNRDAATNVRPSIIVNGNAPAETHEAPASANRPVIAKQSAPSVTPAMMNSTLNAHPVSSQRADGGQADAAPSVDAMVPSAEISALPGMGSSDVASPPVPAINHDGPVRIGGQVKEPKLVSSTLPIYPAIAKKTNIQGDVIIRATIDKDGRVAHMDAVSGPPMLRQPALDALSRWKYEPSKLDGQPVSVQMLVTIKFRR